MIKKEGNQFVIRGENTGKVLGKYPSKDEAESRLRQIEHFKKQGEKREQARNPKKDEK